MRLTSAALHAFDRLTCVLWRPRARQIKKLRSRVAFGPSDRTGQRFLRAVNIETGGTTLWQFPTDARMKASPTTFTFRGKQYVAVAAGPNILLFGL